MLSIIYHNNRKGSAIAAKISVSIAFIQLLCVLAYHTINVLLELPYLSQLKISLAQRLRKLSKLGKVLPFSSQDITMHAMTTHTTLTSTEIGLQDSKDAFAAEDAEHDITPQEIEQSLTTRWEESDSLREPLLQEVY